MAFLTGRRCIVTFSLGKKDAYKSKKIFNYPPYFAVSGTYDQSFYRHHHISPVNKLNSLTRTLICQNKENVHHPLFNILYRFESTGNNFNSSEFTKSIDASGETTEKVLFFESQPAQSITQNPAEAIIDTATVSSSSSASEVLSTTDVTAALPSVSELSAVADIAEPTLASLGLAHWTPVGLVQMLLEYMHVSMSWPWWASIVAATIVARVVMFPVFVKTQRNTIQYAMKMPQLHFLQERFNEARRTGNAYEASKCANEVVKFIKEHNISPFKSALLPLVQAPVFISYFFALRTMAKVPVESMKTGGFSWITDLTIPDPYFVMPIIACGTLFVIIKVGAESGMRLEHMKLGRYIVGAIPLIALPFCINFPSAVLFYWCTNNFLILAMVLLIRVKSIRKALNIPNYVPIDPKFKKKKGFVTGIKDAYEDQKIMGALEDRRRLDEMRFRKAGTGPIPRTYAYDPTKPRPAAAATAALSKIQQSKPKT